jgi:hypothetical protein
MAASFSPACCNIRTSASQDSSTIAGSDCIRSSARVLRAAVISPCMASNSALRAVAGTTNSPSRMLL